VARFFLFLFCLAAGCNELPAVASAVNGIGIVPTVALDAGHGGANLGAHGHTPYCEEKRFTLLTARLVQKYLKGLGYHVVMTRQTDAFIPLPRRVEIANQARVDLFISIHFNSSRILSAQGIEVFFSDARDHKASSKRLAGSILKFVTRRTKAPSRGVKKADFYVIRETDMPAVLVEGGFISNPKERLLLKNPLYLEKIARGIAEGIDNYFQK
jgi:N-acetylmuramoyl-L-alanine amidase